MATLADRFVKKAYDALQAAGRGTTCTINEFASLAADRNASTVSSGAATAHVVKVTPPESRKGSIETGTRLEVGGRAIERKAIQVYLPHGYGSNEITFTPTLTSKTGMTATILGTTYNIVEVEPVVAADQNVMYRLGLER